MSLNKKSSDESMINYVVADTQRNQIEAEGFKENEKDINKSNDGTNTNQSNENVGPMSVNDKSVQPYLSGKEAVQANGGDMQIGLNKISKMLENNDRNKIIAGSVAASLLSGIGLAVLAKKKNAWKPGRRDALTNDIKDMILNK